MNSDAGGAHTVPMGFDCEACGGTSPRHVAAARRVVDEREKTVDTWGNPA